MIDQLRHVVLWGWWVWPGLAVAMAFALRNIRRLVRLADQAPSLAPPRLSIVVPACNEAHTLEPALTKLLATSYPDLEVIVVDDRSTDGTGAIVDRVAARDPRVVPLHVTELPSGWLGKVHALERGREKATGEWVLFTDADIHFAPDALRKAVGYCQARRLDHMTLGPRFDDRSVALEGCLLGFTVVMMSVLDPWELDKPIGRIFTGIGAFNLVRRARLEEVGGLASIRMEVIDDGALALILYEAGARSAYLTGNGEVSLEWYGSLPAFVRGLEKNSFALTKYRVLPGILLSGGMALVFAAVLASFVDALATGHVAAYAVCYAAVSLLVGAGAGRFGMRARVAPLFPLAFGVFSFTLARAMRLTLAQGGIKWRGTLYPLAELRQACRVALPVSAASKKKRAEALAKTVEAQGRSP